MNNSNKEISSYQRNDTNFLRAVAICLIINSHMDSFYPIQLLATGGMIGNSLFFMLSSLGLYLSWQKKKKVEFETWYGQRIARIYPSVWMIVIFIILPNDIYMGLFRSNTFLPEMGNFFYPPFWFLQALLIYYFFLYFILERFSHRYLLVIVTPVLIFYTLYYVFFLDLSTFSIESHFFRVIFYFLIILWGLYLGSIKEKIRFAGVWDILFLLFFVSLIYTHKYFMYRGMLYQIQFVQHIAMFPILYYALKVSNSYFIMNTVMTNSLWRRPINFISERTLEFFIVNNTIESIVSRFNMVFPWNVIMFIILNTVLASIIFYGSQFIPRLITKRIS